MSPRRGKRIVGDNESRFAPRYARASVAMIEKRQP
jgi:hypothetical protein